jgi:hypothetical protein
MLPHMGRNPLLLRQPPKKLLIAPRVPRMIERRTAFASKLVASMPHLFPLSGPFSANNSSTQRNTADGFHLD